MLFLPTEEPTISRTVFMPTQKRAEKTFVQRREIGRMLSATISRASPNSSRQIRGGQQRFDDREQAVSRSFDGWATRHS